SNRLILIPDSSFSGLTLVNFRQRGQEMTIPVIVNKKTGVTFRYRPENRNAKVYVMGNFNNWSRSQTEMFDADGDGTFTRDVFLEDGVYEYQFVVDKKEIRDPVNPEKTDNGFGAFNSLLRVASPDKQNVPNLYFLQQTDSTKLSFALQSSVPGDSLKIFVLQDNSIYGSEPVLQNNIVNIDLTPIKKMTKIVTLRIVATYHNQPGNIITVWLKNGKPLSDSDAFLWQDATIYSLMIDRFADGDTSNNRPVKHPLLDPRANFQGGDFTGIIQKIESGYFDSLGINTIWISPVNKTTNLAYQEWPEPHRYFSGYHGYWPISPDETEPRFGTIQQFQKLVNTAHKHDIKVLLDFVSNHIHIEHPWWTEHRDWFSSLYLPDGSKNLRRWDEYRLTTWFDTYIPTIDYDGSPSAVSTMTDNAVWWLETAQIDGFRHDATKHVSEVFWKRLTRQIKERINPEKVTPVYQIGESYGGLGLIKSYVNNGMLDAQFNFEQYFTLRRIVTDPNGDFRDLAASIQKVFEVFGYNHVMGNIVDNLDQVRIMAFLDEDLTMSDNGTERAWQEPPVTVDHAAAFFKEQMLMTYLLTVPGIPVILYGDEFGMTGANDPDNRRMMRFDDQLTRFEKQQLKIISKLVNIRNSHTALRRGDYFPLFSSKDILVYSRGDAKERFIVTLNKSGIPQKIDLQLPSWIDANNLKSTINGRSLMINDHKVSLNLSAYSGDILRIGG
ncbi:MAG: alpha-amylase family glycosyl hydrolase, partial [Candidatus Marinimicrobia bacterium]|nr:alpha-amylase family glycosyl hydrolase [Candidatus Neomarinimicrobiota bacterium]